MAASSWANEMFSSWSPTAAFVAGVKIGCSSGVVIARPAGRGWPHTVPVFMYSFQPEPATYPRTTASQGSGASRLTSMARPSTCARSSAATALSGASPVRWLGPSGASLANQKSAICVSSRPLPGTGGFITTSKAERRSLATISRRSAPTA